MAGVQVSEEEGWNEVLRSVEVLRRDLRVLEVEAESELAAELRHGLLAIRSSIRGRVEAKEEKTVSLSWRKAEFEAVVEDPLGSPKRRTTVSGYRAGPFGVYRDWSYFKLIHLPTTQFLFQYKLLREAKAAAERLSQLPIDWTQSEVKKVLPTRELKLKVHRVLDASTSELAAGQALLMVSEKVDLGE